MAWKSFENIFTNLFDLMMMFIWKKCINIVCSHPEYGLRSQQDIHSFIHSKDKTVLSIFRALKNCFIGLTCL